MSKLEFHNMRNTLILSLFVLLAAVAYSQDSKAYTAHNKGWLVDLEEAHKQSEAQGKPIMANFTGSDWCGWCKKLTASVFSKPEFKEWAAENVILLELDFPRRTKIPDKYRKQNSNLQQAFKVGGFPTVWIFEMDKNPDTGSFDIAAFGKTGYAPSVAQFTSKADQILEKGGNP